MQQQIAEIQGTLTREIPLAWNGYAVVAFQGQRMRACDVQPGDVLLLDGYVTMVNSVDAVDCSPGGCSAIWIRGDFNIIRFGHEPVTVIRP